MSGSVDQAQDRNSGTIESTNKIVSNATSLRVAVRELHREASMRLRGKGGVVLVKIPGQHHPVCAATVALRLLLDRAKSRFKGFVAPS